MLNGHNDYKRFLMIKGLCDWAEEEKDDAWQPYCCNAAALYTRYSLMSYFGITSEGCHPLPTMMCSGGMAMRPWTATSKAKRPVYHFFGKWPNRSTRMRSMDSAAHSVDRDGRPPYDFAINPGSQFLVRAKDLFGQAKRFYATSLDFVSTFWIDDNNKSMAKEYIQAQMRMEAEKRMSSGSLCSPVRNATIAIRGD